ncbi:unnamed protein product [Paramecium primaurelia]|uniref:Uncharacterized protein n=1 Tax=Paramecium primaurelia TaxID=5886 RepID=A0A8S1JSD7_PARPR|nr:unnamed protein product [Paramecium primaurelia]
MNFILILFIASIKALPLYLAVFADDQQESKVYMRLKVLDAVKILMNRYPQDQDVQYMYYELINNKTYRSPPNLHITTFYIGDNKDAEQSVYYKNFTVNLPQEMKIYAVALLPKRVIACVVKRQDYAVPIENKFPHMTTLLGNWTAVDSNVLMASLFDDYGPLNNIYDSLFEQSEIKVYSTLINGKGEKNLPAYVVKMPISIDGQTQYGFQ